jgi:WD40 repeat protein
MRSHQDEVLDIAHNTPTAKLVTVSRDGTIKIWNAASMVQLFEFESANDTPLVVSSSKVDPIVAVGFKSGFIRIFDLYKLELYFETMTNSSEIKDLQFSPDSKFLSVIDRDSRISIYNVDKKLAIKNIDFSCPNDNYFSLAFSQNSELMANISTNANMITIWETTNFSLKFPPIDLTGDIL